MSAAVGDVNQRNAKESAGQEIGGAELECRRKRARNEPTIRAEAWTGSGNLRREAPGRYSDAGFAPGKRLLRNLIWPSWFDSCSATWNHLA